MPGTIQETDRGSPGPALPQLLLLPQNLSPIRQGLAFENCVLFPVHGCGHQSRTPLLLGYKANERKPSSLVSKAPPSEVKDSEQQNEGGVQAEEWVEGVSLKFHKMSFERFRKELNKSPRPMESFVFIKKELIQLLSKQTAAQAWAFLCYC